MLDIKFIRENKDLIQEGARKKHIDFDIEKLIEVDDRRRSVSQKLEEKRNEQNKFNDEISKAISLGNLTEKRRLIDEMQPLKEKIQKIEEDLKPIFQEWQSLMIQVPNVPDVSVPEGDNDLSNLEVKIWGKRKEFAFKPKGHIEIMQNLDMVDFDKGSKVSGFRGYFLKNDGALLSFAIWQAALKHFLSKGFTPMIVPSMVNRETLLGSGYLPQGEEDLYKNQDNAYFAGTAEVATMAFHTDDTLDKNSLPKKYLSFSPCFRREAGAHGKDTKGLIRVHEFFKLEQVVICEASHTESVKYHEEINRNTEEFIELLGIPYHTVVNCGGDLGLGQVKKYDIELWVPEQGLYREIGSASYFHDFQTRRLNIRYRAEDGKLRYAHSLNATAIPTPRILVSLVENYQEEDGSVSIPEVLRPYMGGKSKISK